MKKTYIFILLLLITTFMNAQRGVKIGYIDTEYILENLQEYKQVSTRLEEKAKDWKKEIEDRARKIEQKKEALNSERILLTSEMIEEIEEEISFDEEELNEYQQKRFGPRGDLIIQKQQLIQPIQDQIFNAIKELAKSKNYDFIFDKSADIVMLYSDRRYDISDQILRTISRANNRRKLDSRKDKREIENESLIDDSIDVTEVVDDNENDIEDKEDTKVKSTGPKKKLTVKELLEQRKQKNSNKRKVKD
ncbi:MAG: OmpH family outer membrane protein [Flavobacteriaceae bacterium]|nr:MAG: OmpH family outer membrane protein [Bacteroidota bacterium]